MSLVPISIHSVFLCSIYALRPVIGTQNLTLITIATSIPIQFNNIFMSNFKLLHLYVNK
jgi:hypothetical protein